MPLLLKTLLVSVFFVSSAHALSVQRIYADLERLVFVNDSGEAQARDLYIEIGSRGGDREPRPRPAVPQDLYIFRNGDDLEIQTSLTTIAWKGVPNWLTVSLNLQAQDVIARLGYNPSHFVGIKELRITKPSLGQARLKDIKVECTPESEDISRFENLLGQCLKQGKISGGAFDIPKLKTFLAEDVLNEPQLGNSLRELGKSLQLIISENSYSLDVLTFMMGINLRSHGTVHFDEATKLATIRVNTIRFGKINITKMAFAVLRDVLTTDGIRVQAPYLYIQL